MTNGKSIVMFENNSEMRNFLKICIFYRFNKYIKISLFAFARYTVWFRSKNMVIAWLFKQYTGIMVVTQ